ncbi:MAG: NAD(P)/FAD-dependent oxidoreductase [Hyphomonadaceae bacterium]|nr:NAD(P)/FAD-dependent oxidoreductase [Hyphomonadaceae bacterium]
MSNLETDYLIVGAGASGLAFADEMLTRSDAHMVLIDRRHAPGGHWNDAYGFVRLHQPSVFYGVSSRELAEPSLDQTGPNAGFMGLATGAQVAGYFHSVLEERLLKSGRVTWLPGHEFTEAGEVRNILSGEIQPITVRRKRVDATYHTNSIPKTHTRNFQVAATVACIPPNDLPDLASQYAHFTVLGGGKTGMDSCIWLLSHGVPAAQIRWVVPRDCWLWNRAFTQPDDSFFETVFGGFLNRQRAIAEATSPQDLALRFEAIGMWMRLTPEVEPTVYRGATMSEREVEMLRGIDDTVRLGRVQKITSSALHLERGELPTPPETLYIDCTASAVHAEKPPVPVFQDKLITLQMIRFPQIPFSAAISAYLETLLESDAEKNRFTQPIYLDDSVAGFVRSMGPDFTNRLNAGTHPQVRRWVNESRLDGFARIAANVDRADSAKMAILRELRDANFAAAANLTKLLAQLEERAA